MKLNKKLKVIIIVVAIFLIIVTIYKFNFYKKSTNNIEIKKQEIVKNRKDIIQNEVKDIDKYSEKIITTSLLSIDYNFFSEGESVTGEVYINNEGYLYINDYNNRYSIKISDLKFRTMYAKEYEYDGIYIFLISQDNKVYYMGLVSNNIKKAEVIELMTDYKVEKFVDIDFKLDMYGSYNTVFVLSNDGNFYELGSNIRYNEDIISLYNKFYVYNDNTISNVFGNMLTDENGNYYKIKYCFLSNQDTDIVEKNTPVIITEDNKLIYIDNNNKTVYEYNKKIKDITYDTKYPYIKSKLEIEFKDNTKINFEASCNQYYCISDLT